MSSLSLNIAKLINDIIFADPPYDLKGIETIPDLVMKNKLLKDDGVLILEHSRDYNFSEHVSFSEHRNYGKVNFSFFK